MITPDTFKTNFYGIRNNLPANMEFLNEFPSTNIGLDSQTLLNNANIFYQFWQKNFNSKKLNQLLSEYLELTKEPSEALYLIKNQIKEFRKISLILGSVFYFVSENQYLSYQTINFLRLMGQLGDNFFENNGDEAARKLLELLKEDNLFKINFSMPTKEVFVYKLKEIINRAKSYLQEKEILIKDFHTIRKDLRHILNLFQIEASLKPDDEKLKLTFYFLVNLNTDLGHVHDEYVARSINGEIDYESMFITTPEELKIKLLGFYQNFEKLLS